MNKLLVISIILISGLLFQNSSCNSDEPKPQFPAYDSNTPIVNPPEVFQVIYDISYNGSRLANITFEENAVWKVEKLGDVRIYFWAENDTTALVIEKIDTLGLKAGYNYIFGANNNNYEEFNTLFTQFNKLNIDYDTFDPKF